MRATKPSRILLGLGIAFLVAVGACGDDSVGGTEATDPTVTKADPAAADRAEVEAARETWEVAGIRSYRYSVIEICFCPPLRARVDVVDGVVVSVVPLDGTDPERAESLGLTMEEWLSRAAGVISSDPEATYGLTLDPDLGYPRSFGLDPDSAVADDQFSVSITDFESVSDG